MLRWSDEEEVADLGEPCSWISAGETCGATENVSLLDGRPLCDEHRDEVVRRRQDRLLGDR